MKSVFPTMKSNGWQPADRRSRSCRAASARWGGARARRRHRVLRLEQLEGRVLLHGGEITGLVWFDVDQNGTAETGEPGLGDWEVYLDGNANGVRDGELLTAPATGLPLSIADGSTTNSTVVVGGLERPIADVDVTLSIDHTFLGDLDVFLVSPLGTRVELFTDVGGGGNSLSGTTLDDDAAHGIAAASAPFAGSFYPEGSLAALVGEDANGTWTLEVSDDAAQDVGTLLAWSLTIVTDVEPAVSTESDGTYEFHTLDTGTYRVRPTLPSGWTDTAPGGDGSQTVILTMPDEEVEGVDFGAWSAAPVDGAIAGTVWNDLDGSGTQQAGELGLAGREVYLDSNDNGVRDGGALSVASTDVPLPIVDQQTVASQLTVSGFPGTVGSVEISLSLDHTYDADLDAFLISPAGTRVELFSDVGGPGNDFVNTTLADDAALSVTAGTAPFSGNFRPEGALASFAGEYPNGIWTLEITDDAYRDSGTLLAWSLDLVSEPELSALTDANGDFALHGAPGGAWTLRETRPAGWTPTFPAGDGSHSVVVTPGAITSGMLFGDQSNLAVQDIEGSVWNDLDGDGARQQGEAGLSDWTVFIDSNQNGQLDQELLEPVSTDVPQPINDLTTITSDINVSGFVTPLTDVNVFLIINHTYDADLDVFLISPSGTRVELFTDVGGSGNDFLDTTLDDESPIPITSGSPPFITSFQPEGQLSTLQGENANGTWKLEITDDANADTGQLVEWSLTLVGESEPVALTDSLGDYVFQDVPLGTHVVGEIVDPPWQQTYPGGGTHTVLLDATGPAQGIDFGNLNMQPGLPLPPDLFVWENAQYLGDWIIDTTSQPGNTLLRFSTSIANIGTGPLEVYGGQTYPDDTQDVFQRIYDSDGNFTDQLAGTFVYHPEHGHIHFDGYAEYNLRTVEAGGGVGPIVASGDKISFCLIDVAPYDTNLPGAPSTAQHTSCGTSQGISVGWADVYGDHLPDQWIDVTGVADGDYWLEVVTDPDDQLVEMDETNNTTRIQITLNLSGGAAPARSPAGGFGSPPTAALVSASWGGVAGENDPVLATERADLLLGPIEAAPVASPLRAAAPDTEFDLLRRDAATGDEIEAPDDADARDALFAQWGAELLAD